MTEIKDIITIILALYGAILSSILAIRELNKEKRKILIFLDYVEFYSNYKITLINIGYRPIKLVWCGIKLLEKHGDRYMSDPLSYKVDQKISAAFPIILTDGEHTTIDIPFSFDSPYDMKRKKEQLEAYTRDAEGNIYITKKIRIYNPKTDQFS